MFPCALFFIAIGTYSTNNAIFDVYEVMFFGIIGAILLALDFPVAPILLGYVLGPLVEENFRRALLLSQGDMAVFVQRPISAVFVGLCALLVLGQIYFGVRAARRKDEQQRMFCLPTFRHCIACPISNDYECGPRF